MRFDLTRSNQAIITAFAHTDFLHQMQPSIHPESIQDSKRVPRPRRTKRRK